MCTQTTPKTNISIGDSQLCMGCDNNKRTSLFFESFTQVFPPNELFMYFSQLFPLFGEFFYLSSLKIRFVKKKKKKKKRISK